MIQNALSPRQATLEKYVGRHCGRLVITGFSHYCKRRIAYYAYKCECGKSGYLRSSRIGVTRSCGCLIGDTRRNGFEDISGTYWSSIRFGAKEQGCGFEISKEYVWGLFIKQNRKCILSGVDIAFQPNHFDDQTASIVRIDKSSGFTDSNILLVHKVVGRMIGSLAIDRFIFWCNRVAENNKCQS